MVALTPCPAGARRVLEILFVFPQTRQRGRPDDPQRPSLAFTKYQGLGNDFILVDNRGSAVPAVTPAQAVQLCDRHTGVGADGVILALPPPAGADLTMVVLNSDGSESEMCGNGIRCLARFVAAADGSGPRSYAVATGAGLITPQLLADGSVCVDMGPPVLAPPLVPTTLAPTHASGAAVAAPLVVDGVEWAVSCVSMGNPHCVVFGRAGDAHGLDLGALPLERLGPLFERHAAFPRRTNTHFVAVESRTSLRVRVWERGAGATLACGTGACAVLVAAALEGRCERDATVHLPGGPLRIEWREADNRVYMTGPAERVFDGLVNLDVVPGCPLPA